MKLPMIVLREKAPSTRVRKKDFALVATRDGDQPGRRELLVEVRDTSEQDRRDLRKETGIVAAAPPMPVALIKSIPVPIGLIRSFRDAVSADGDAPKEGWGIAAVNATKTELTGKGVIVALLDTGIDATHAAFKGVELIRQNFTKEADDDNDGHGTHCAGTFFGRDVDGHRIGIARGVSKALIGKVIGKNGGSTEQIVKAIAWVQSSGAQVISMSLGLDFIAYQKMLQTDYGMKEQQAISFALVGYRDNVRLFDKISNVTSSNGAILNSAVVTAAAGNESKRPDYSVTVAPPAAAELFLSVAALGPGTDSGPPYPIAEFSNAGAVFAAPGVDIWSANNGGGLVAMSGTSQATPHVAGVAALWVEKLMAERGFTAAKAIEGMKQASVKLVPLVAEDDARYGLVQAPTK